jgi:DNA repair ATPase RecN
MEVSMNQTRWLAGAGLTAVAITAAVVGASLLRGNGAAGGEVERDRERAVARVAEFREAMAECNAEVAAEQVRFAAHEARVDSFRAVVQGYESDARTVPAEDFEAYLEAFHAYNESVGAWHERAEALEAAWESCRELTERHNALVDSLSAPGPGGTGRPRPSAPELRDPAPSAHVG